MIFPAANRCQEVILRRAGVDKSSSGLRESPAKMIGKNAEINCLPAELDMSRPFSDA